MRQTHESDGAEGHSWSCPMTPKAFQYQEENTECRICGSECSKNKKRHYAKPAIDKEYPNI